MKTRRLVALAAAIAAALTYSCVPAVAPEARSSAKTFERLSLLASQNPQLDDDYDASWSNSRHAWLIQALPWETDVTSLIATFAVSDGASISVAGTPQLSDVTANDFSSGLTYTITAEDGTSMDHAVFVYKSGESFPVLTFTTAQNPVLDGDYSTSWDDSRSAWVAAGLPWDADLSALVATFSAHSATLTVDNVVQASGMTPNDYRGGLLYTMRTPSGATSRHSVLIDRSPPAPATGTLGVALTVMAYNAENYDASDTTRHASLATMIKNASAEIVILTETSTTGATSAIPSLQSALSLAGWVLPHAAIVDVGTEQDIAVLSLYTIESYAAFRSPTSVGGIWPRPGLIAAVSVSNGSETATLEIVGLHLKASYSSDSPSQEASNVGKRIAQAADLMDYFRGVYDNGITDRYILVAGDMNTWRPGDRGSPTSTLGYLRSYDDASPSNDFTAVNEQYLPATSTHQLGSVLDHIILSPALFARYRPGSIQVKTADQSVTMSALSDHYPVLLELDL